ncbi:MAG: Potassium voltage-gated channel subfamily KQT; possible potassium channel, VIC family, partial [uncultured Rubellimicrobium sp.]
DTGPGYRPATGAPADRPAPGPLRRPRPRLPPLPLGAPRLRHRDAGLHRGHVLHRTEQPDRDRGRGHGAPDPHRARRPHAGQPPPPARAPAPVHLDRHRRRRVLPRPHHGRGRRLPARAANPADPAHLHDAQRDEGTPRPLPPGRGGGPRHRQPPRLHLHHDRHRLRDAAPHQRAHHQLRRRALLHRDRPHDHRLRRHHPSGHHGADAHRGHHDLRGDPVPAARAGPVPPQQGPAPLPDLRPPAPRPRRRPLQGLRHHAQHSRRRLGL